MKLENPFVFLLVHFHDEKGINRPGWERISEEAAINYAPLNLMFPHAGGLLRSEASDSIENDIDVLFLTKEKLQRYCNRYVAFKNSCPPFAIQDSSNEDILLQPVLISQNGNYLYRNSLLILPIDLYEYDNFEELDRTIWGMKGMDYELRLRETETQDAIFMNNFNTFIQCILSEIDDTNASLHLTDAPEANYSFRTIVYSTIMAEDGEDITQEEMEKLCFAGHGKNLNKSADKSYLYEDMGIQDMILCENTYGKAFIQKGKTVYTTISSHDVDVRIGRGESINLYLELMVETQKNSLMNMLCAIQDVDLNDTGELGTQAIRDTLRSLIQTQINEQFFTISDTVDNLNNYYSHLCQSYQLAPLYEEAEKKIAMVNTFLSQVHEANNELADQQQNRQNWFLSIVLAILTVTSASNDILDFSTKVETIESGSLWYVWGGRLFFIVTIAVIALLIHKVMGSSGKLKNITKKKSSHKDYLSHIT